LLGTGEQLIKTLFAKELCETLHADQDHSIEISNFLDQTIQKFNGLETAVGFIALIEDSYGYEFWFGHTTESMGLAYMAGCCLEPKFEVSRKKSGVKFKLCGNSFKKIANTL
jgi:taspase (threonine aspartase 1)